MKIHNCFGGSLLEHELHNNKSTNSNSNDSSYNLLHMEQEKLDKWGYPIHPEMNFMKPEGDFETRIALVIAFSTIIIGIIYAQIQL